jgi:GNAT superfamily N-acetyltransferase
LWSEWQTDDLATAAVRVERHAGPRGELGPLFEEAEDSAQELDGYIDQGEVLVAIVEDRVIGHLQLIANREGNGSEIKNVAVEATHRGRGIGRLLIEGAIDQARSHGHSALTVATAAADVGNLRFYQRAGFRMRQIERDRNRGAARSPRSASTMSLSSIQIDFSQRITIVGQGIGRLHRQRGPRARSRPPRPCGSSVRRWRHCRSRSRLFSGAFAPRSLAR